MTTETRLTVAEAAAAYKVSEKTIRRWAKDGVIQSERLGRTVRILVGLPSEHRNADRRDGI
jgi:excisionase family DNA binding protein